MEKCPSAQLARRGKRMIKVGAVLEWRSVRAVYGAVLERLCAHKAPEVRILSSPPSYLDFQDKF